VSDCFICARHSDPATDALVVAADEHVIVAHVPLVTPAGESAAVAALVERLRGHQMVSKSSS
jgi:hypothetical protein